MAKTVNNTPKQEDILSQFAELATDYEKAKEAITRLVEQNAGLDDKLAAERITSRALDNKLNQLSLSLTLKDSEIERQREEIQELEESIIWKNNLSVSKDEDIRAIKAEISLKEKEIEKLSEIIKVLRNGLVDKQQKLDAQSEWNKTLNTEITRLLAYEKAHKEEAKKWKNPKIWDVWNLFLKWLFPPSQTQFPAASAAGTLKKHGFRPSTHTDSKSVPYEESSPAGCDSKPDTPQGELKKSK